MELVLLEGLAPSLLAEPGFEAGGSAVPPQEHRIWDPFIALVFPAPTGQEGCVKLVPSEGLEPTLFAF